jgi:SAM-dependent methyltransferase
MRGHRIAKTVTATPDQAQSALKAGYLDIRYGEGVRPFTDYPYQLTRHLSETFLAERRGQRLLDLGCGRGEFLHGFASLGFDAVGVDRESPKHPRFSEPILEADFSRESLPFSNASVSIIFNKSVFEHVWDISRLLAECYRVLEPGGRMITMVPDWKSQASYFYDDWTHVRPFTLVGLKECLTCHGFSLQHAERFRQLPFLWQRPYLRPVAAVAARMPDFLIEKSKLVKFAKGFMLLVVADKPHEANPQRSGER